MRQCMFIVLLAALLLAPSPARAQNEITLDRLTVRLWPEYDQPSMLVIYNIVLSADTTLPAEVVLRIPAAAEKPYVVAVGTTFDTATDQGIDYSYQPSGDWVEVTIQAAGPAIILEYYDPSLVIDDARRTFTYVWPGDYAIETFELRLREPPDLLSLTTRPTLAERIVESGSNYNGITLTNMAAGRRFALEIEYERSSDRLTVSEAVVQPSAPLDKNVAGRVAISNYLPWLLGGLSALILAGVGLYLWQGTRTRKPAPRRRARAASEESSTGQIYCHQCGQRAHPGDRFCRTCGTRLRREG